MMRERDLGDLLLETSGDGVLVVGPPTIRPDIEAWYFTVGPCDDEFFRLDRVVTTIAPTVEDYAKALACRDAVAAELAARPGVTVYTADDEHSMLQACERLWPCEEVTVLRKAVEAELGASTMLQ